eukprot:6324469-Prymnesium_polylepis.1
MGAWRGRPVLRRARREPRHRAALARGGGGDRDARRGATSAYRGGPLLDRRLRRRVGCAGQRRGRQHL